MYFLSLCDSSFQWQCNFQDPARPTIDGIIRFHHDLIFILTFVVFFVSWILWYCVKNFNKTKPTNITHGVSLEIIWTIIPALILICIAIPSFALLYSIDEPTNPYITVTVVGHQWYWRYEYSDYLNYDKSLNFDSYILNFND